ncbi:MAG: endolytic transglycosylase MltG [Gemmatimonadetes bacterium]|nr:endolytic transglycosylase MltG [Gemmatimonadota bacterium]
MAKKRRRQLSPWRRTVRDAAVAVVVVTVLLVAAAAYLFVAATAPGHGARSRVRIPEGAGFDQITDSLAAHGVVRAPRLFRVYAKFTGQAREVKPGTYAFRREVGWRRVLSDLVAGRTLIERLVIPEGWNTFRIAPRLARITGVPEDSVFAFLRDEANAARFHVPGPTLEGYLYPATYTFSVDESLDSVVARLVRAYDRVWTPARRARADSLGMSEREVVALASIIEAEAKRPAEMPLISAVYHNRLRIGYPLQADPTVQYALGRHRSRLLYADIDSVADNPYNTYRHKGLPPGPIGSPSERAIDAALYPAAARFLYFVARPDGTHIFTSSLAEHNRAKAAARALFAAAESATAAAGAPAPAPASTAAGARPTQQKPAGSAPAAPPATRPR